MGRSGPANLEIFNELAGAEGTLTGCGRVLTPAGIVAVGRAFAGAGITGDQVRSLAPDRVWVGRVPSGGDEELARALVQIGLHPEFTVAEPVAGGETESAG